MDWEALHAACRVGQSVRFETDSPIYRGPYESLVVDVLDEAIRIAMPLDSGRLVLIPVGTTLRLQILGGTGHVEAVVTDRRGGRERFLEVRPVTEEPAFEQDPPESSPPTSPSPIIAVTSGKGGVGKTTLAVNIAIALEALGKRACIIDGDLGTANVDVMLKLAPPFNLADVVSGTKHMVEVLVEGPKGILVLPGGSGLRNLTRLPDEAFAELIAQFRELEEFADVILLDTGSGVAPSVTNFVASATSAILVTTPEPHAVTDAYAMLRVLAEEGHRVPTHLIVNRAQSDREGMETTNRMVYAARRFLHHEVKPLGVVREDPSVARAVRQQSDLFTAFPRARVTHDIQGIAEELVKQMMETALHEDRDRSGTGTFLQRIRSLWTGRRAGRSAGGREV